METVVRMKRILVLGAGGSGKTAFALALAAKTGLPLFHLDALYWQPGWKQPEPAAWQKTVADLVAQDKWIIEGSYGGTLDLRVPKADYIFYLDTPNWRCVWNILKRRIKYARFVGRTRPGMAAECPEKISFSFLMWVWLYPRKNKPKVLASITKLKHPDAKFLIFKSYDTMDKFLAELYD